jgi:uncharacterized protein YdiU (UPF0061 family)
LNLKPGENTEAKDELISQFFLFLAQTKIPYEQLFFDLHSGLRSERLQRSPYHELYASSAFADLSQALSHFEADDPTLVAHSYFERTAPCTLLIDELENIWAPIADHDDWSLFEKKLIEIREFRGIYRGWQA